LLISKSSRIIGTDPTYSLTSAVTIYLDKGEDSMFLTLRIMTWASILFISIYAISPIYIVQTTGDGTGRVLPHNTHAITLANRTFRLPCTEEMNSDFHHHDAQGNDLIRVEKRNAVIRASIYLKPLLTKDILTLPSCSNTHYLTIQTRYLEIDAGVKLHMTHGFLSGKTGHSPPSSLS
jgi:hypothetical protein